MAFTPYSNDITVKCVRNGQILLGVRGSESYQSGEYTNTRNTSITVPVSPDTARDLIGNLEPSLKQIKD